MCRKGDSYGLNRNAVLLFEQMYVIVFVTTKKGVADMKDTTLLDGTEPLSLERLRGYFLAHDFSTQTAGYKFKNAPSEKNQMYLKAKGIFRTFWEKQMKKLCNKGSLRNFTKDAPIRCLEESEENLVAGTVMELMHKEDHCITLMDQILTSMQGPMNSEIEKFAQAKGKTVQELTEEEFQQAVDAFADEFLSRMMTLLLQVQEVPKLTKFLSKNGAQEDFDENVCKNYNKISFYRKWDHLRTKLGKPVPLTREMEETVPAPAGQLAVEGISLGLVAADSSEELYHSLLNAFINSLTDEVDREIMYMRADGKTQSEIAVALGYANHSPVTKRLQRLKKQFHIFMAQRNGT